MRARLKSKIERVKTGWYIWLFPLIAVGITGWLFFDYHRERGPLVHIHFEDASGIQPEKTRVLFRGVAVGTVEDVRISEDQKEVVVDVLLHKDAENFAVEGTKFSLVTPHVSFGGISGLDTLFQGAYIAVLPGPVEGASRMDFHAANTPSLDPLDDTSPYLIETDSVESISAGDAVTYRGLKVGSVTKFHLNRDARKVAFQINVENRFVRLIRENTVFWRKVGVQAHLSLFGSEIKLNSMESIMRGGVEFATPSAPGHVAKALHHFELAPTPPKDLGKWNPGLD
jgi:paraquat-inducible protein B